ncbi:hypothetical protein AB0K48_01735 [Nonomuraea sp. NPDC055795]
MLRGFGTGCQSEPPPTIRSAISASPRSTAVQSTRRPTIKTVCHELGHTAGLDHYSPLAQFPEFPGEPQDCMASSEVNAIANRYNPAASWIWTYINDANPWWS